MFSKISTVFMGSLLDLTPPHFRTSDEDIGLKAKLYVANLLNKILVISLLAISQEALNRQANYVTTFGALLHFAFFSTEPVMDCLRALKALRPFLWPRSRAQNKAVTMFPCIEYTCQKALGSQPRKTPSHLDLPLPI